MGIGLLFWIIMIIWLLFGFWSNRTDTGFNVPGLGGGLIFWILLALLGWHAFGPPIR